MNWQKMSAYSGRMPLAWSTVTRKVNTLPSFKWSPISSVNPSIVIFPSKVADFKSWRDTNIPHETTLVFLTLLFLKCSFRQHFIPIKHCFSFEPKLFDDNQKMQIPGNSFSAQFFKRRTPASIIRNPSVIPPALSHILEGQSESLSIAD